MRELFLFLLAYAATTLLSPIIAAFNVVRKFYRKESVPAYLKDAAIGFDQAGGSILYQQENFTISSYTYYLCKKRQNIYACRFMQFIDLLFGKGHCQRAYEWEIKNDLEDIRKIT